MTSATYQTLVDQSYATVAAEQRAGRRRVLRGVLDGHVVADDDRQLPRLHGLLRLAHRRLVGDAARLRGRRPFKNPAICTDSQGMAEPRSARPARGLLGEAKDTLARRAVWRVTRLRDEGAAEGRRGPSRVIVGRCVGAARGDAGRPVALRRRRQRARRAAGARARRPARGTTIRAKVSMEVAQLALECVSATDECYAQVGPLSAGRSLAVGADRARCRRPRRQGDSRPARRRTRHADRARRRGLSEERRRDRRTPPPGRTRVDAGTAAVPPGPLSQRERTPVSTRVCGRCRRPLARTRERGRGAGALSVLRRAGRSRGRSRLRGPRASVVAQPAPTRDDAGDRQEARGGIRVGAGRERDTHDAGAFVRGAARGDPRRHPPRRREPPPPPTPPPVVLRAAACTLGHDPAAIVRAPPRQPSAARRRLGEPRR